ncbi:hypothetical protein J7K93_09315 [bacterium]|nr:hypothetical protein [bacterium]
MNRRIRILFISFPLLVVSLFLMTCYSGHGLSPVVSGGGATGIRGHIDFKGVWPDSTKEVRVAVLAKYPEGIQDQDSLLGFVINNLIAFSDTIPKYSDSYDYFISLDEGFYEWIVVVWFPDIPLYLFGVRELGAYYENGTSNIPSPVYVSKGSVISSIDITADFKNVDSDTPFYKRDVR